MCRSQLDGEWNAVQPLTYRRRQRRVGVAPIARAEVSRPLRKQLDRVGLLAPAVDHRQRLKRHHALTRDTEPLS